MTNQEAIDKLTYSRQVADDEYQKEWCEALDMAIKALEQEPCDKYIKEIDHLRKDISKLETQIVEQEPKTGHWILIDKEASLEKDETLSDYPYCHCGARMVEIQTGHWIEHNHNGLSYIECSKCSSWFLRMYLTRNSYCPNCGAKMVEPQESEDKE